MFVTALDKKSPSYKYSFRQQIKRFESELQVLSQKFQSFLTIYNNITEDICNICDSKEATFKGSVAGGYEACSLMCIAICLVAI